MQEFIINVGNVHFTSLERTAAFYARVMQHWSAATKALPISWTSIRYEDLVANPEQELARLADNMGLPWEQGMLDHVSQAKHQRIIQTASYSQVVLPIYARSVNRWNAYRNSMAPILPVLTPFIKKFGYSDV